MNISQLSEQLKDVPQVKLIDYAKNPNSVVPQFLALAEIQRRQSLQRTSGPAPQSSVAEDIMAQEAPAMPMQAPVGVAGLPTRGMYTAPESLAGGGIIAFADGGEAEEEYEEALAKSRRSRLQGLQEALAEAGTFAKNPLAKLEGKQAPAQRMAIAETASDIMPTKKGSHKYEDLVLAEAQRQGLDPALARHVLYKETGNLANPESAKSRAGALGVMQLMPKTAKMLGVDPLNPEENIRGGVTYLKQMYDKYNDPVLAAAAYNAGPGRLDKALKGQGIQALPRETRMYIAGLAEGGEVKRYAKAGSVEEEESDYLKRSRGLYEGVRELGASLTDPKNYDLYRMYQEYIGQPFERGAKRLVNMPVEEQAQKFRSYSMTPNAAPQVGYSAPVQAPAPVKTADVAMPKQSDQAEVRRVDNAITAQQQFNYPPQGGVGPTDAELGVGAQAAAAPKGATSQSYFDALMKNIEEQAADAKKSGDMNKYLSLMQAGFGMMASTSPYAMTGIGQGAMTGVGTYAGLEKGRREQERGIMAAQLGLGKAKASQEESEALRLATEKYREATGARLGEESKTKETAMFRDDLRQYEQMRIKQIENKYKGNPLFGSDPKLQDQFNKEIGAIQNDPQYLALLKRAYPGLELPKSSPIGGGEKKKPLSSFGS
jgi:hypothetical protein